MFTLLINEGDGTGAQSWDRYYEVLWQEMRKRLKKEQQRCQFWFWYDCATNAKPKAIYLSVQFSSVAQSCPTLWDPMDCSTPGFPGHHQLPKLAQTHVHRVSDAIQSSHPLSSPSPPAFNLSQHQGLFQWISSSHRRPKYQSFSFSISPSNEYSWLISFRMNWLNLLAVQGTPKSLLQYHSSKASVLWCSAFFMVQFSHLYMTTGKTIAFTRQTFAGKVMSLLFNMLSRSRLYIVTVLI